MTPPEFSVLLLAWDDADPGVTVLGGEALPATRAMVYQLAARQPVLAVYPHLPAAAAPAKSSPPPSGRKSSKSTAQPTSATPLPEPGVIHLPPPSYSTTAQPAPASRIVGLHDLTPARSAQPQTILGPPPAVPLRRPLAPVRSQWPTAPAPGQPQQWQEPAAPYAGASPAVVQPLSIAPLPLSGARPASPLAPTRQAALRPNRRPLAGDLHFDPDPELPNLLRLLVFGELSEEVGAAEAYDLAATEDDLMPDEKAVASEPAVAESEPAAPPAPTILTPVLDGLNFRMIQYARRAAQLVRERSDFGIIYAPNWPAWLAALEIRNSSRQPLVLYAASLAADFAAPAERGWLLEVERMALRRASLILVPDETLHRRLRAQYGATIGEVRVVAAADEQHVQQVLREVSAG